MCGHTHDCMTCASCNTSLVILGHVFISTSDEEKNVTDLLSSTKAKGMFKDLDDKLVPRLASVERKSEKTAGRQQPASRRLLPFVFRRNRSSMHTLPVGVRTVHVRVHVCALTLHARVVNTHTRALVHDCTHVCTRSSHVRHTTIRTCTHTHAHARTRSGPSGGTHCRQQE